MLGSQTPMRLGSQVPRECFRISEMSFQKLPAIQEKLYVVTGEHCGTVTSEERWHYSQTSYRARRVSPTTSSMRRLGEMLNCISRQCRRHDRCKSRSRLFRWRTTRLEGRWSLATHARETSRPRSFDSTRMLLA